MGRAAKTGAGIVLSGGVALVGGLWAMFAVNHREVRPLDAAARATELAATVDATTIELPLGVTHYELSGPTDGPTDGPLVVLLHGGTIPMWTWDAQVPALTAAGYRVLRYDQFGRGLSDRPDVEYDRALYQDQLAQLLTALQIEGTFDLVGLSFGGAVAATYAAAHPARVRRVVLVAPIVHYAEGKLLFDVAKIPGVGEWYARVISVPSTVQRASAFFPPDQAEAMVARFESQTTYEGYERSLLSYARGDALQDYRPAYTATASQPALVLFGAEDHETVPAHVDFLREQFGDRFQTVPGGGHGMHSVTPALINAPILAFLADEAAAD
jgi:pimeloyl-ACP methyl ester carboxylesterase